MQDTLSRSLVRSKLLSAVCWQTQSLQFQTFHSQSCNPCWSRAVFGLFLNQDWPGVPLDTMIKFKRLAALSTDFDVITAAVKLSTSGLMEVCIYVILYTAECVEVLDWNVKLNWHQLLNVRGSHEPSCYKYGTYFRWVKTTKRSDVRQTNLYQKILRTGKMIFYKGQSMLWVAVWFVCLFVFKKELCWNVGIF